MIDDRNPRHYAGGDIILTPLSSLSGSRHAPMITVRNQNIQRLLNFRASTGATLLGVGPMSVNCVDAAIALANEHRMFLMVIASRRQIDSAEFGGGYVNGWTTEQFAEHVRARDEGGFIVLARDHGGPWQNELETRQQMDLAAAMAASKRSFQADIEAGFDMIHIDPSHASNGCDAPTTEDFTKRTKELLAFCKQVAAQAGREVAIEIGTDEGRIGTAPAAEIEMMAADVKDFCRNEGYDAPEFLVIQTGTKVMEMQNVGPLDAQVQHGGDVDCCSTLPTLMNIGDRLGFVTKEHNADYLSAPTLRWHVRRQIGAANVAPEFGVTESKTFVKMVRAAGVPHLEDRFIELAYASRKWEKWMLPGTAATDYDRAIIAGHYVFATPQFREIRQEAAAQCSRHGIDLQYELLSAVKSAMMRFVLPFGMAQAIGA
jgi:fructose/tagatose bisphosphate aldolase